MTSSALSRRGAADWAAGLGSDHRRTERRPGAWTTSSSPDYGPALTSLASPLQTRRQQLLHAWIRRWRNDEGLLFLRRRLRLFICLALDVRSFDLCMCYDSPSDPPDGSSDPPGPQSGKERRPSNAPTGIL
ncbi:unnamed protein product [Merluccius merluccius]